MTNEEAIEIVMLLATEHDVPAWSRDRVKLYAELIRDLDAEPARAVVIELLRTREDRAAPHPATIRRLVAERRARELACGWLPVDEAWAEVQKALTCVGRYREFPDTHPFVKQ